MVEIHRLFAISYQHYLSNIPNCGSQLYEKAFLVLTSDPESIM